MVSSITTYNRRKSGTKSQQFPQRLHNLMEYVEQKRLQHVITWVLQGRGFMIQNPDGLVKLLPLFFSQTKYRSFRRQLNMWHFERIESGPHKGAFIHPYFVRDDRDLSSCMSRQVSLKEPRRDPSMISIEPESFALDSDILEPIGGAVAVYDESEDQHNDNSYFPAATNMEQTSLSNSFWLEPNSLIQFNTTSSSGGDLSKVSLNDSMPPTTISTSFPLPHKSLASSFETKQECYPPLTTSYSSTLVDNDFMNIIIENETRMALKSINNVSWNRLFSETSNGVRVLEDDPLGVDLDDFDLDVTDLFTLA